MKLWTSGPAGAETPVATIDGTDYDVSTVTAAFDPAFFAADGPARIAAAAEAGELTAFTAEEGARIGSPLARPQALICI